MLFTRTVLASLFLIVYLTFTHAQLSRTGVYTNLYTYAGNTTAATTLSGLITSPSVSLHTPSRLHAANNVLYISTSSNTIRSINSQGMLSTESFLISNGVEFNGEILALTTPSQDERSTMYFATADQRIMKVTYSQSGTKQITEFCGLNNTINAVRAENCSIGTFTAIADILVDSDFLYVLEDTRLSKIRLSNQSFVQTHTFAASSTKSRFCKSHEKQTALYFTRFSSLQQMAFEFNLNLTVMAGNETSEGMVDTHGTAARFTTLYGCYIFNGVAYVADEGNERIRTVSLTAPYTVSTFATSNLTQTVTTTLTTPDFSGPQDVHMSATTLDMFITASKSNVIKAVCMCNPSGSNTTTCDMSQGFGVCTCKEGYTGNRCQSSVNADPAGAAQNLLAEINRYTSTSYDVSVKGLSKLANDAQTLRSSSACQTSETCRTTAQSAFLALILKARTSVEEAAVASRRPADELSLLQTLVSDLTLLDIEANLPLRKMFSNIQCESSFALLNGTATIETASTIMQHALNVQRSEAAHANEDLSSSLTCFSQKYARDAPFRDNLLLTTANFQLYSYKENSTILASHVITFSNVAVRLSAGMTQVLPSEQSFTLNAIRPRMQLADNEVSRVEVNIFDQNGHMNITSMSPPAEISFDVSGFSTPLGLATGEYESGYKFVCKYWDTVTGKWSTSGMGTTSMSKTSVTCSTTHFSTFAVIYEYTEVPPKDTKPYWITLIAVFSAFSLLALTFVGGLLFVMLYRLWKEQNEAKLAETALATSGSGKT